MVKRTLATAVVRAFAGHCPKDVKHNGAALAKNTSLTSAQMAEVKKVHDEGNNPNRSGKHGAALEALHKATEMLVSSTRRLDPPIAP